ncbi:MAG: hypothetical protein ABR572_04500 [Cryomorphaceae bacterium]|nr:hypothetical protein [Flavobacteriales bacterium]
MKKFLWIAGIVLLIALSIFIWWRYFFVFSEGVKSGDLNYFEKKGTIWKTYEGRIVQAGFQSPTAGSLQSNEFRFSVIDEAVADELERAGGRFVELRYMEYIRPVPWRGASEYIVTEVLEIDKPQRDKNMPVR